MKILFVTAEHFKLDGGACFGVVPKSLWSQIYPADENNMIVFALRNLLVKEENRMILFDTGVGNKQDEKFRSHFYISGENNLMDSLHSLGFSPDDITDVVHTHLHFDHCGGTFRKNKAGDIVPTFKNAVLWCSQAQWNWANKPNKREKASFLIENLSPMEQSGKLRLIEKEKQFTENIFLRFSNGHTEGQIIPIIRHKDKTLAYMADFIPTTAHIHMPYVAAFDTRPLLSMDEKQNFLNEAVENNYILLFQHDALNECCTLQNTGKGIRLKEKGTLDFFLNT